MSSTLYKSIHRILATLSSRSVLRGYVLFVVFILSNCNPAAKSTGTVPADEKTNFTNPLLPSGPDPWVIYKDGFYYYTNTTGSRLVIWKTKTLTDLQHAEKKTIWTPPPGTAWSREIWAPELHFLNGKWYMYFAADDGNNNNHRMYVVENANADPMQGEWTFKGKVADPADKWAIDGTVIEHRNQLYMAWSGWEGDVNGRQDLYIAKMKNPWTIEGQRKRISSPLMSWEKNGDTGLTRSNPQVYVNEGPQFLQKGNKLFIIFSANGCWTDLYALGMLSISAKGNLLDSASWTKNPGPVFKGVAENQAYAPGHNSFFKSPDGKEDWILYHANPGPRQGCGGRRSPRAQPFTWKTDGTPDFGKPVKLGDSLPTPGLGKRVKMKGLS